MNFSGRNRIAPHAYVYGLDGALLAETDAAGAVVWRATYDPFGQAVVEADPDGDGQALTFNPRFPGQYYDAETGLHYNYFRYYDPEPGRYITSDPIGLAGGLNTYLYVEANPLRFTDPLGLEAVPPVVPGAPGLPVVVPPVAIPGTPENQGFVDMVTKALGALPSFEIQCIGGRCLPVPVHNEEASEDAENCPPTDHAKDRSQEAETDKHRQVGDPNKVIERGRKFIDTETGNELLSNLVYASPP